jgi:hypothetical protein
MIDVLYLLIFSYPFYGDVCDLPLNHQKRRSPLLCEVRAFDGSSYVSV